jgi:hypothetical protein
MPWSVDLLQFFKLVAHRQRISQKADHDHINSVNPDSLPMTVAQLNPKLRTGLHERRNLNAKSVPANRDGRHEFGVRRSGLRGAQSRHSLVPKLNAVLHTDRQPTRNRSQNRQGNNNRFHIFSHTKQARTPQPTIFQKMPVSRKNGAGPQPSVAPATLASQGMAPQTAKSSSVIRQHQQVVNRPSFVKMVRGRNLLRPRNRLRHRG